MWLCLKIGSLKRQLRLNEVSELEPKPIWLVSVRGEWDPGRERENHVKTQGEESHLQTKGRSLRRNQPCWRPALRLPASRLWENRLLSFKMPVYGIYYGKPMQNNTGTLLLRCSSQRPITPTQSQGKYPTNPIEGTFYKISEQSSSKLLRLSKVKVKKKKKIWESLNRHDSYL